MFLGYMLFCKKKNLHFFRPLEISNAGFIRVQSFLFYRLKIQGSDILRNIQRKNKGHTTVAKK